MRFSYVYHDRGRGGRSTRAGRRMEQITLEREEMRLAEERAAFAARHPQASPAPGRVKTFYSHPDERVRATRRMWTAIVISGLWIAASISSFSDPTQALGGSIGMLLFGVLVGGPISVWFIHQRRSIDTAAVLQRAQVQDASADPSVRTFGDFPPAV